MAIRGTLELPGDKSISHRALILAACSVGKVQIKNLLFFDFFHTILILNITNTYSIIINNINVDY